MCSSVNGDDDSEILYLGIVHVNRLEQSLDPQEFWIGESCYRGCYCELLWLALDIPLPH